MPNLRVISDNAIDRATLSATNTAINFDPAFLKLRRKSDTWRASGVSARLNAAWATPEQIQGIALPHTTVSPTGTMRVRTTTEQQATNVLNSPADFTNGAWVKTNMNVTSGVTGPDGTSSAMTLTATAGNGELRQAVSVAAGNWVSSIYVRRRSGGGAVYIRNAANTGWMQPSGLSGSWMRFVNDGGSTSNAALDIMIGSSGDAIDVAFAQVEFGAAATSYYPGTRPLGYIDGWQSYSYDVTTVACPAPAVKLAGFTAAQAASAYAFGGGATPRVWLPNAQAVYGLAVDLVDPSNAAGFLDAAYLVAGQFWESATNFDYNASAQMVDASKGSLNDAGDWLVDIGTLTKKLSIPMSKLSASDQTALWNIFLSCGTRAPVFVSMFAGDTDLSLEARHQAYGCFVELPAMALPYFRLGSATLQIQSI